MTFLPDTHLASILFQHGIRRLTNDFTGRDWIFDKIDEWLKNKSNRFFILTGEPGVGKSAIAAQLTKIRNNDIKAYHFCRAGDEKPSDLVVYFGQERFSVTWTPVKIYVVNY